MRRVFQSPVKRNAQTLVFFLLAFGTIFLLCGFAIDSGLLYLAKARLSRAVDGAALAAVGNFHQSDDPATNRQLVSVTMRNFAAANYTDLQSISATATETASSTIPVVYTYNFNDGTTDPNGNPPYRRYVQVVLQTGAGGQITSATCSARCPARTYFMGYAGSFFKDMKVSSSAVATRNPRLIMIVVDRSASMLAYPGGGAYGLPDAIVTFLNFFDTTSDYIGIASFSSNGRLEMPLTTNFLTAGTNVLYNSYDTNFHVPGIDPEQSADPVNYATHGVRRMKFGGQTAADEGMRIALEQMMANPGFNNPNVTKYIVLFTDGAWNDVRTLLAAPGYTNVVAVPGPLAGGINSYSTNNTAPFPVPTLSPNPEVALADVSSSFESSYDAFNPAHHGSDTWQSADGQYEPPLAPAFIEGAPLYVSNSTPNLGPSGLGGSIYATNINVWLQPGSVDYVYDGVHATPSSTYVSCYTNSVTNVDIGLLPGGSNVLVVPGYIIDGTFTDSLDLAYPDSGSGLSYRADNYLEPFMWPDDPGSADVITSGINSTMRKEMFRNYVNLLTGFYIYRADDPPSIPPTTEPLDDVSTYIRPLNGLGPYYPGGAFYWPFGDMYQIGLGLGPVGVNTGYWLSSNSSFALIDPLNDPSTDTVHSPARHLSYSINMLATNAAPNWAGELFYDGTQGTNVISGTSTNSVSTQMTSANVSDWQGGAGTTPGSWLQGFINAGLSSGILIQDPSHYGTGSTNTINGEVLRPFTFNGSGVPANLLSGLSAVTPGGSATGGYVTDGAGNYYKNAMAYSGRPTHFYDFSQSKWVPFVQNHTYPPNEALPLCIWKVQEYAWHARAAGVTVYTVGYGSLVDDSEQLLLAQVANATNTTAGGGSNLLSWNQSQPLGQQFHATTTNDIIADFQSIAQAINAALTQ
jgi:Flp pilus assembly protein TadG